MTWSKMRLMVTQDSQNGYGLYTPPFNRHLRLIVGNDLVFIDNMTEKNQAKNPKTSTDIYDRNKNDHKNKLPSLKFEGMVIQKIQIWKNILCDHECSYRQLIKVNQKISFI